MRSHTCSTVCLVQLLVRQDWIVHNHKGDTIRKETLGMKNAAVLGTQSQKHQERYRQFPSPICMWIPRDTGIVRLPFHFKQGLVWNFTWSSSASSVWSDFSHFISALFYLRCTVSGKALFLSINESLQKVLGEWDALMILPRCHCIRGLTVKVLSPHSLFSLKRS